MKNHPVVKGPEGGRLQHARGYDRHLLDGPIKTGPRGGHFQGPKSDPRYLLHTTTAKVKKK